MVPVIHAKYQYREKSRNLRSNVVRILRFLIRLQSFARARKRDPENLLFSFHGRFIIRSGISSLSLPLSLSPSLSLSLSLSLKKLTAMKNVDTTKATFTRRDSTRVEIQPGTHVNAVARLHGNPGRNFNPGQEARVEKGGKCMYTVKTGLKRFIVYFCMVLFQKIIPVVGKQLIEFFALDSNPPLVNTRQISTRLSCKHSLTFRKV